MRSAMKTTALLPIILLLGAAACSRQNPRLATTPNQSAALHGDLPANPLAWQVITSEIDRQHATMSTLFGNDTAIHYARANAGHDYPPGSVLSMVTWDQQEDSRWFGANIPAEPRSVEFVTVGVAPNHEPTYAYREFAGAPLKQTVAIDGSVPHDRAAYILSQRAAVMP